MSGGFADLKHDEFKDLDFRTFGVEGRVCGRACGPGCNLSRLVRSVRSCTRFLGVPEGPYRDTRRRRALCLSPHGRYPEAFAYHLRRRRRRALWLWGGWWLAAGGGLVAGWQLVRGWLGLPACLAAQKRIAVAQAASLPFPGNCVSRCASPSRPWSSLHIARCGTPRGPSCSR